jgi:hypothetical protein
MLSLIPHEQREQAVRWFSLEHPRLRRVLTVIAGMKKGSSAMDVVSVIVFGKRGRFRPIVEADGACTTHVNLPASDSCEI